jgi:hypothetical protein
VNALPETRGRKSVSKEAYRYLARRPDGFLQVDGHARKAIIQRIANGDWGGRPQRSPVSVTAFDMVRLARTGIYSGELTEAEVRKLALPDFKRMKLIEVKATRGPRKRTLANLFFSFQYAEQIAAQTLGDRYSLMFVVINKPPARSFYRSMAWPQMWAKARSIHLQFSVTF